MTITHGKASTYNNGCRCDACRARNAERQREQRVRMAGCVVPKHVHGTYGGYTNWSCRCGPCTEANKVACRERWAAR